MDCQSGCFSRRPSAGRQIIKVGEWGLLSQIKGLPNNKINNSNYKNLKTITLLFLIIRILYS